MYQYTSIYQYDLIRSPSAKPASDTSYGWACGPSHAKDRIKYCNESLALANMPETLSWSLENSGDSGCKWVIYTTTHRELFERSWSGFFAAQRLKLWASKRVRPVLFDVMSFYGLWKDKLMWKKRTSGSFHARLIVFFKMCVFIKMNESNYLSRSHRLHKQISAESKLPLRDP